MELFLASCTECAAELSCDGHMRICSTCKKDCCIYCTKVVDNDRLCSECSTTSAKAELLSAFDHCKLCNRDYPPLMFYNCVVCEEKRCFQCVNQVINDAEAYCKTCSDPCSFIGCEFFTTFPFAEKCGKCNESTALCQLHTSEMTFCNSDECAKILCTECVQGLRRRYGHNEQMFKKTLYCSEHGDKCVSCHDFINSEEWTVCQAVVVGQKNNPRKCSRKCCEKCHATIFPIVGKNVCSEHTITCDLCGSYEIAPGHHVHGDDQTLCFTCMNKIQTPLQTFCMVWNRSQNESFPDVLLVAHLLLQHTISPRLYDGLWHPLPDKPLPSPITTFNPFDQTML